MFTVLLSIIVRGIENFPIIVLLTGFILFALAIYVFYRYVYIRKRVRAPIDQLNTDQQPSVKECERHMKQLAELHQHSKYSRHNFIIGDRNQIAYNRLNDIRLHLENVSSDIISLIPAARWLFDNFYMMHRELKKVKTTGTSRRILPIITSGAFRGYPRIYIVARKMVLISGGYLSEENISAMLEAYQSVTPLTSAELWALQEMLGLCLLESIIDVAGDILRIIKTKAAADDFVREKLSRQKDGMDISVLLSDGLSKEYVSDNVFHSHVMYCLKNMSADESQIHRYAAKWAADMENVLKPSDIFLKEGRFETCLESIIRILIVSLRAVNEINCENLFEVVSPIEKILMQDPADVYWKMDFGTRNRYRREVEKLAMRYKLSEYDVAEKVIFAANANKNNSLLHCSSHVGTYLMGKGKHLLIADITKKPVKENIQRYKNHKGKLYFYSIALLSIIILALLIEAAAGSGYMPYDTGLILFLITIVFPVMGISIELTNNAISRTKSAKELPSLDFIKEIPDECRTFVVMPVIIASCEHANQYAKRMEKHYFANMQSNLYFAILGDFADAPERVMPQDDLILNAAKEAVRALNKKYPSEYPRFSLFMRYRKWNASEGCWMGWERKRGKLEEFNSLLCGEEGTTFSIVHSNKEMLHTFKYVITLDADTNLIRDCAAKFVGILEHPLNQPLIDPMTNKVKEGYAIIQPAIGNHIFSAKSGLFPRIFAGQSGLDPYSNVIADVYQDIFKEGIFRGKGIYNVQVFHQILHKTFPDNRVLSHDLLESCYVRCAFSNNVKLMDDYPLSVLSYAKREHRWIRGDWQLLPWLFGKSPIYGVSRWKIFDNLRRSMLPVCQLSAVLINAFLLPEAFYLWIPIVFFSDAFHFVATILNTAIQKLTRPKLEVVILNIIRELFNILGQAVFGFILMPYRSWISLDAIARTLFRLIISHKQLLQWKTAEAAETNVKRTWLGYYSYMWMVVFSSAAMGAAAVLTDVIPIVKLFFLLLGIIWMLSPMSAYLLSRPKKVSKAALLKDEDKAYLRLIARRTWQYFKDFSTLENNWLCPDNYQLAPNLKVTHKTSPTNIGLQLLSLMSARDLGYTSLLSMAEDYENTMYTLAVLPKWHGHLYNWYDIKTLEVLNPHYVSTVDSGNFIGYIITLKNGLIDLLDQPIFPISVVDGILDTIALSGVDVNIPKNFHTVADFIRELSCIIESLKNSERKAWEDRKWVGVLIDTCEDFLHDAKELGAPEVAFADQNTLRKLANDGSSEAMVLVSRLNGLILTLDNMARFVDFKFLFNDKRLLLHIGYHVSSHKLDAGCYDLMASESSLTSFLAIARGEVPQEHWFKLGRPLTMIRGIPAFVSWSGTMFEYLMPNLVMKEYPGSVFCQTSQAAVLQQISYAKKMKLPWGISESQYFRFDLDSNYQYKAFGVPKLRLQPTLNDSLVVAPYATMLAMHLLPHEALNNMHKFIQMGAEGEYGFYEALDFNDPDTVTMQPYSIVKCFMAHHQGMSLVSINNLLNHNIMQLRFHNEPMIKATEILLEEMRNTNLISISRKGYNIQFRHLELPEDAMTNRHINRTTPAFPCAHWLSNEHYSVMVTSDGDGFSRYKDITLNRWRSDLYASAGNYIYIRDVNEKKCWSTAYKPTRVEPDEYHVVFSHHQAEFKRRDGDIVTHTAVTLSPSQDIEVRKVTITNHGNKQVIIEMTSYLEVVVDRFLSELSHPAFNKLFIESEYVADHSMLLCKRRNSTGTEKLPYLIHMVKTNVNMLRSAEYETDRLRFLGRNNTPERPDAINENHHLSNTAGFSIDPILSLRTSITVPAGNSVSVSFVTGVCFSREEALRLSEELNESFRIDDVFKQFRLQSVLELKYLNINSKQFNAFQDLIGPIFYPFAPYRGPAESIRRNWKNQSFLWRFGVSGDNPILLLRVNSVEEVGIIKDVLKAYEYLRINQVKVDLIILSEEKDGYMQELTSMLADMTSALKVYDENSSKPSLFILHTNQMHPAEVDLLFTVARIVFSEKTGIYFRNVREHIEELQKNNPQIVERFIPEQKAYIPYQEDGKNNTGYEFFNGFGGFVDNGREYEILLDGQHKPPMPWINVIANDRFGFQVSETGAGYTWSVNSRENKITSWSNDPVTDPAPEVIYIRDEQTGNIFSPVSLGSVDRGLYRIRHGFGYSVFEHKENDIEQEMIVYVPLEEPVKIWKLSLTNTANIERHLSITLFAEWVLGVDREFTAPYIVTSYDNENEYLSAKSIYNYYFRRHNAFMFSSEMITAYTGDRREFLGVNGSVSHPKGLGNKLSCNTGVGLDPCGVIQITVAMKPGEKKEVIFGLGQSDDSELIDTLCLKYRKVEQADIALKQVKKYWQQLTESIVVKTSDRAFDIMANGWLLYQTVACRIKARAAFYQCGGAYGFRDQLQDVLALLDADPEAVKKQIFIACSRQFEEGDVQHWWHYPIGVGVRTRITDDLLWLPYVTAAYIRHTGDYTVLEENIPYLTGAALQPEVHEMMYIPQISDKVSSVYEHCMRAILHTQFGKHGLPLMGGGDWNDGMNCVGIGGKGESVWLGWFLHAVFVEFIPVCHYKNDLLHERELEDAAAALLESIEENAWDGDWYLRAYYDDYQKLGSKENEECRIDSISQSWSVISGAGRRERTLQALYSATRYLVKPEEGISLLLMPPFDKTEKNPGYIKNYYPGIRENGGQYTHAAVWLAIANAMVKDCKTAHNLLTMLNPIHSTSSKKDAMKYEKEPYVMIADISMGTPYAGRGGWSWYTGSAGWMYQALIRWFLGIRRQGGRLVIDHATPPDFGDFTVKYRFGGALYEITVKGGIKPDRCISSILVDGIKIEGNSFDLVDDNNTHYVLVEAN